MPTGDHDKIDPLLSFAEKVIIERDPAISDVSPTAKHGDHLGGHDHLRY